MSDTSQGPGWWQASDGKWYPPQQHPDAGSPEPAAAPPIPPAEPPPPEPAKAEEPPPEEPKPEALPPPVQGDVPFNPKATQVIQRPVLPPKPADDAPLPGPPEAPAPGAPGQPVPPPPPMADAPPPAPAPPAPSAEPMPPPAAPPLPPPSPGGPPPTPVAPGAPAPGQPPSQFPGGPVCGPPIPGGPGGPPPAKKKGGAGKIILILVIVIVLIAVAVGLYFFVFNKKKTGADVMAEGGIATQNLTSTSPPQNDLNLPPAGQLKCDGKGAQLTAGGSLTNKSGATSDYDVTVEFRKDNTPLTTGTSKVSGVAANETKDWSVTVSQDVTGQFACRVIKVDRFNAGTTTPN